MSLLSFLCNGVTFANFRMSVKTPVSKHKFTNFDNQIEKKSLKLFKRKTGIPFGPVDFEESNESIILLISSGIVGPRKKESPSGLMNNLPFLSRFCRDNL